MIASGIVGDLAEHGAGAGAVIVAATVSLIPGCGPQIIAISAYVGVISFPALVSSAISQDRDALFPLLVRHKVASIWATIHTTLPAIIVGLAFFWVMGVSIPYREPTALSSFPTSLGVSMFRCRNGSDTSIRIGSTRSLSGLDGGKSKILNTSCSREVVDGPHDHHWQDRQIDSTANEVRVESGNPSINQHN